LGIPGVLREFAVVSPLAVVDFFLWERGASIFGAFGG